MLGLSFNLQFFTSLGSQACATASGQGGFLQRAAGRLFWTLPLAAMGCWYPSYKVTGHSGLGPTLLLLS